jgi:hypothetical protein
MAHGLVNIPALLFMVGAGVSGAFLVIGLLAVWTIPVAGKDAALQGAIARRQFALTVAVGVWLEILAIGLKTIWG